MNWDGVIPLPDYIGRMIDIRHWIVEGKYHKWSLTICDGCFDTLKSSKMRS